MIDNQLLIEEIITKECERYELEKNGFVADRRSVIKELSSGYYTGLPKNCSRKDFLEWKERLLNEWYVRKGFARFFRRKAEKRCVYWMVKRLLLNAISHLQKKQTEETVDDELRVEGGRTVAFKLSSALFAQLYRETCCNDTLFVSPGQMEETCIHRLYALYPLKYSSLYERLLARDNEFWEEIWRLIRRFINFLVTQNRGREDEETVKEVSMETVLSIQEQLKRGKLEQIMSARHLLHSLQMTGRHKAHEWFRAEAKRKEELLLEDEEWQCFEYQNSVVGSSEKVDGRFAYLLEVNEKSAYEVSCALADVLSWGCGKVYEDLVAGMQDTVRAMSMLYVDDKKYEEIAQAIYGDYDSRRLDNLRQSVSRGKEYLKKKMVNLIIDYKRKGYVPLVIEGEE